MAALPPIRPCLAALMAAVACAGEAPASGDAVPPAVAADRAPPDQDAALIERRALAARDSWWSWKPLAADAPPGVREGGWVRTPIDRFVLAKLEAAGVEHAPEASREALVRRATFDLTGLPPTPEEVHAFVADDSPDAWDRLIDRLLASPAYGERWARHWLDLVRYADTNGFERDGEKTGAWRYRDWVIASLNADKPYDRFVQEQLAGDELPDRDFGSLVATGYYRLGMWDDEVPDLAQAVADDMDGIVDVTARTFLGIGMGCVRCHDHKADPIAHRDYYRFAAYFAGVRPYKSSPFNSIDAESVIRCAKPEFGLAGPDADCGPQGDGESVLAVREAAEPRATHVLLRGSPHSPGEPVDPGVPAIAARFEPETPAARPHGESSGRRLALARWITDPRNALALRTIANRIWQHHFGVGLCPTTNDLGKLGERPTDAALLDWLAAQVPANGWSLKAMHRLVMLSAAYRMSSVPTPDALAKDAPNELLSRFRMRRLEAEEVRDAMLAAAGTLTAARGGPGVRPPMPAEALATSSKPDEVWPVTPEDTWKRRTVYMEVKRSLLHPLLAVLDVADVDSPCPVRFATVQPTQALSMFNGALTNSMALDLARRVMRERPEDVRAQLAWARELTSGRAAPARDLDEAEAFVAELRARDGMDAEQSMQAYCLVLLNLNDFLSVD